MRKIGVLVLCIILLLLTISCSNNTNDITTEVDSKDDNQKEITILIKDYELWDMKNYNSVIYAYFKRFEIENGVKVNLDVIKGNNADDYNKKINTKLYLKEGPTLIYIAGYGTYRNYTEQRIAVNTEGKIPNFLKVYDSLCDDGHYFIPVGMTHWAVVLNRCAIDKLEIDDPKFDWTREEYLEIKEKWLEIEKEYFCESDYEELLTFMINNIEIIDEANKKVNLNNSKVIQYLNDVREEIFSGKYIINNDYTCENFYNMVIERNSKEYKQASKLKYVNENDSLKKYSLLTNGLKSLEIAHFINMRNDVALPNIIKENDDLLATCGFIVNRNGKNIDLGMEFINGLLSDEIQLEMFKSIEFETAYPVNREIENDIEKIEKEKEINEKAIKLRKYILQQVKIGNYKRSYDSRIIKEIKTMIQKDFAKFIFADQAYTDEQLGRELQKLENKYNMWLNE
ncbi:extracellular solute-binding protein [Abyssisolibacter fermentans]|uniref:extracellular solute-binding protein n=1 Tax=Abyssisolibacter fermentans TaxID=1766203 RepID=UPI00082E0746|nr:extracellular solute-binding protein [Abyssisolibacter fermentans]